MLKTTRDMMLPTAITGPTRARCGSTAASTPPPPDVPSRSPADNLENLLAALGRQSVRAGRLIIAVESPDDPAYRRATELAKTHREPAIDVVVASVSNRRGQKCTNILAALTRLAADDRFVVMLDADICPQSAWRETTRHRRGSLLRMG
jgi:hypothetical protein